MRRTLLLCCLLILTTLGIAPNESYAQQQCPLAESVTYPFDPSQFQLTQAFGVPSPRHLGRYHTGEDWHAGPGVTEGLPVRAIANGRVTYSFALGWGRDGGVVILEHTFADGSVIYSQYGHITESDTVKFPMRLGCVAQGDVIGVIGSARPAPHLHFEIRVSGADSPGPGYAWEAPYDGGWRHPSQFIINRQAWNSPAHLWHLNTVSPAGFTAPPLRLVDNSVIYGDGGSLRLATSDGRVLWRMLYDDPAAAVTDSQGQPLVVHTSGTLRMTDYEGGTIQTWTLNTPLQAPGYPAGGDLLFSTPDGALVALDVEGRRVRWRADDIPRPVRVMANDDLIAITTGAAEVIVLSREGEVLSREQRASAVSFAAGPDDALLAYDSGGLWRIDAGGGWSTVFTGPAALNDASALAVSEDGRAFYAFDGAVLRAYDASGAVQWETPLAMSGRVEMQIIEGHLLLVSSMGEIAAVRPDAPTPGTLCGALRVFGDGRVLTWADLGRDGTLRVLVGDQLIGLDWAAVTRRCAG